MNRRLAIGFTAMLALIAIAGLTLHAKGGEDETVTSISGSSTEAITAWEGELVQRGLAELRIGEARGLASITAGFGAVEVMPGSFRDRIARNLKGIEPLHLRFDRAQHVRTKDGIGLWIVEGQAVTCLFHDGNPAMSCDTTANVRRRGLYIETYELLDDTSGKPTPTNFELVGVLPLGMRAARAQIGHRVFDIPAFHRLYDYQSQGPIRLIY